MTRPCYLVVDKEHAGSISSRKLVLETAKLNVITAYSGIEAIDTLRRFPALDAAVIDAVLGDMTCEELVSRLKAIDPKLVIIVVGGPSHWDCEGADHFLESFDPARLLDLLKVLAPKVVGEIMEREAQGPDA